MKKTGTMKRILVVDDEAPIRVLLRKLLEDHGYESLLAGDGEAAYRMFEEFQPELVVMDIMMPVENGLSVVSRIRKLNPSVRVIYLSAYFDETAIEGTLVEELSNYPHYKLLKKPFDVNSLLEAVEKFCSPS